MRINKFLSTSLGISRRKADVLIKSNKIKVNSDFAKPGQNIANEDVVYFNSEVIKANQEFFYLMLNKPAGYVCSREGQGSKTIYSLLPPNYQNLRYIGRLDKDSTGLLLMTNDGEFINKLTHPRYEKTKIYVIKLDKHLKQTDQAHISKQGVILEDGLSKFEILFESGQLTIRLKEGRNRQIRRTFEKLGYTVTALHRTNFGKYELGDLKPSEFKLVDKII